jgi:vesicle-associated membrane protein 7
VDKTENLSAEGFTFLRESRRLKTVMWWQNARLWAVVVAVVTLLVYFIMAMACGFTLSKC